MHEFKSWRSYADFASTVTRKTRFLQDPEVVHFLDAVRNSAKKRIIQIPKGRTLWRAQVGHGWKKFFTKDGKFRGCIEHPFSSERMKPNGQFTIEGRANPKGILALYVSTKRETALKEVRPWKGAILSIAKLKTNTDLTVCNCFRKTSMQKVMWMDDEPTPGKRESIAWNAIDKAFALPVIPNDASPDYVPTQIIAELLRQEGFSGIQYRSSLDDGKNLVLFDLQSTDIVDLQIAKCNNIEIEFEQVKMTAMMSLAEACGALSNTTHSVSDHLGHNELAGHEFRKLCEL